MDTVAHLLWVVRNRARLMPRVADVDEASAVVITDTVPVSLGAPRSPRVSAGKTADLMTGARMASARRDAEARAEAASALHFDGPPSA